VPDFAGGPATFLFSDIEGSTRLLTSLGDAYGAVFDEHQRLLRSSFAAHSGVEISTEGDSFFVVFEAAIDAIAAAADAQRALAEHVWPVDRAVRVRIGIHSGRAVKTAGDYVGIDINRTARIAAAGHGGQVLVSEPTANATAGSLPEGVELEDLGRHRLKDVGVERLWQLRIDGLPSEFEPLRSLEAHPSNLPVESGPLVDRDEACRALGELIRTTRIVTVTGPGGIGKSRIAVHAARDALDTFPDGIVYLDLAPIQEAEAAAMALASVLGVPASPSLSPVDSVIDHIGPRHLLLVLDTAERVAGASGLLGTIAGRCPNLRMLVTSRSPIRVSGEREYPLGPLPLRSDDPTVHVSPAAQLFLDRARAVRPDLDAGGETTEVVEAICARLEGLPLAIELAAARLRVLPAASILARLTHALPFLAGGPSDAPTRQRTLRDTIEWSVSLLEPGDRAALECVSLFVGSFDLDGADAVADLGGDALDVVERLVGLNLLAVVLADAGPRFRAQRLIREYGLEALDARDVDGAARHRYARYWVDQVRALTVAVDGPGEARALADLRRDLGDLRAVLEWATDPEAPWAERSAVAVELAGRLGAFWWLTSQAREGGRWLERSLEHAGSSGSSTSSDPADAADEARARYWAGVLADELGRYELADRRLEEALVLQESLADELWVARTLNSQGVVARSLGDLDRAERLLEASLARKRAIPGQPKLSTTLNNLAILAADRGDTVRAIGLLEDAIRLEADSTAGGAAFSHLTLGAVRIQSGDTAGVEDIRRILPTLLELEAEDAIADGFEALAVAALRTGDPSRAARLLAAADSIRHRIAVPLRDVDRATVEEVRAALASALDPTELDAARADAAAMEVADLVAFALQGA
jgi:predicted ATPase/class 3 adenylate cyclase